MVAYKKVPGVSDVVKGLAGGAGGLAMGLGQMLLLRKWIKGAAGAGAVGKAAAGAVGSGVTMLPFPMAGAAGAGLTIGNSIVATLASSATAVLVGGTIGTAIGTAIYRMSPSWMPGSKKWNQKMASERQEADREKYGGKLGQDERVDAYMAAHPGMSREEAQRRVSHAGALRDDKLKRAAGVPEQRQAPNLAANQPAMDAAMANKAFIESQIGNISTSGAGIQQARDALMADLKARNPNLPLADLGSLYKKNAIRMGIEQPSKQAERIAMPGWASGPKPSATAEDKWTAFRDKIASIRGERDAIRGRREAMRAERQGGAPTNNVTNTVTINVSSDGVVTGAAGSGLEKVAQAVAKLITDEALGVMG
jgi:hypothetical protein